MILYCTILLLYPHTTTPFLSFIPRLLENTVETASLAPQHTAPSSCVTIYTLVTSRGTRTLIMLTPLLQEPVLQCARQCSEARCSARPFCRRRLERVQQLVCS